VTHRDRLVCWLAAHIPIRLLAEPERWFLAAGTIVIGSDAVRSGPGTILHGASRLLTTEFALCFLAGGLLTLAGLWRHRIWLERAGQGLTALGCLVFIIGVIQFAGPTGYPNAIVYGGIGATYCLRLLSTAAARVRLHQQANGPHNGGDHHE
jgi:peptidoglycan/LPS O-acetylase OafA/YrhL